MEQLSIECKINRIAWPTTIGHVITAPEEILYCKAEGSYTRVNLVNGKELFISYNLKKIENTLSGLPFFRTHNSFLVNLHHVGALIRQDHEFLVEINGTFIPLAKARRKNLLERFREV